MINLANLFWNIYFNRLSILSLHSHHRLDGIADT